MTKTATRVPSRYNISCNPTMFNCCPNYQSPDWSQFDGLEISACYDDGHGTSEPMVDEHEAAFFTVYGHFAPCSETGGGVEALTDVSTRRLAQRVAERMIELADEQDVRLGYGITHY